MDNYSNYMLNALLSLKDIYCCFRVSAYILLLIVVAAG